MTDPDRYSQKEMDQILGRAIERSKEPPAGVDHETMVEAAQEVGLSREDVEAAAREVKDARARRSRRVILGVAIGGAVVLIGTAAFGLRAWLAQTGPLADGVYVLHSKAGDTCMSGPGWTKAGWASADERLTDTACVSSDAQKWIVRINPDHTVSVESKPGKKCLDVPRYSTAEGVALQQYECRPTTNQKWTATPVSGGGRALASVASGKCVTIGGATGQPLHQATCEGAKTQLWAFEKASE